jgi:cell division protein FtsB
MGDKILSISLNLLREYFKLHAYFGREKFHVYASPNETKLYENSYL